jgi:hypothetical protein
MPTTEQQLEAAREMLAALESCATQFYFYADQHMRKTPPDTTKAATNVEFAGLCHAAIAAAKAAGLGEG